jgi:hypothetical protein
MSVNWSRVEARDIPESKVKEPEAEAPEFKGPLSPAIVAYLRLEVQRVLRSWLGTDTDVVAREAEAALQAATPSNEKDLASRHTHRKRWEFPRNVWEEVQDLVQYGPWAVPSGKADLRRLVSSLCLSRMGTVRHGNLKDVVYADLFRLFSSRREYADRVDNLVSVIDFLGLDAALTTRQFILATEVTFDEACRHSTAKLAEDLPSTAMEVHVRLSDEEFWAESVLTGDKEVSLRQDLAQLTAHLSLRALLTLNRRVQVLERRLASAPSSPNS